MKRLLENILDKVESGHPARHLVKDAIAKLEEHEQRMREEWKSVCDEISRIGCQASRVLAGNSPKKGEAKQFAAFVLEKARAIAETEATCRVCGCTDSVACPTGCWWIELDRAAGTGLCSNCEGKETNG